MVKAAFFSDQPHQIARVFGGGRKERLQAELEFYPEIVDTQNFERCSPRMSDLEVIFSTWGMPPLTPGQVQALPALKVVFYAAGSVQYFARPFLENGVQVVSAWGASSVPVSQMALAQIILGAKGYFQALRQCRTPEGRQGFASHNPGLLGASVALLGAGMIGTRVIELLRPPLLDRPADLEILVFDPYLGEERAAYLGVKKVRLEEAFEQANVISNHIPDLPETRGMLARSLFERMRPYATFINTARGATIDEPGMLAVMAARPDLTALLDVTFPEPPLPDNPLYRLENVLLTPHIAGSVGSEVWRQADYMIEEWRRYQAGEKLLYAVSLDMLKTMA